MKKKTPKIKQRDKVIIDFYLCCPYCDEEITGRGIKHVELNYDQHLERHQKKKVKK